MQQDKHIFVRIVKHILFKGLGEITKAWDLTEVDVSRDATYRCIQVRSSF